MYTRAIRGSTCRVNLWSKYLYVWILLLSNSHSFYFNKHVRCIIITQSGPNTAQWCKHRWAAKWFENIVFAPLNPALKQPNETETLGGWLFSQYLPPPPGPKNQVGGPVHRNTPPHTLSVVSRTINNITEQKRYRRTMKCIVNQFKI